MDEDTRLHMQQGRDRKIFAIGEVLGMAGSISYERQRSVIRGEVKTETLAGYVEEMGGPAFCGETICIDWPAFATLLRTVQEDAKAEGLEIGRESGSL